MRRLDWQEEGELRQQDDPEEYHAQVVAGRTNTQDGARRGDQWNTDATQEHLRHQRVGQFWEPAREVKQGRDAGRTEYNPAHGHERARVGQRMHADGNGQACPSPATKAQQERRRMADMP